MYPAIFACYTQKTLSHFLLNTRGSHKLQTLLSPPQKGRRKLWGALREEGQKSQTLSHRTRDSTEVAGGPRPSPTGFGVCTAPRDSTEVAGGPRPSPTTFTLLSAPRDSSEAASLKSLGPHGQKAHNLRGYIGGYFPLCTFSSVHFFVV